VYRLKKFNFLLTSLNHKESVMKKTLLALSVAALAASSAQAYNFHVDQTGTDVDFYGSLRVKWESTSNKTNYVAGGESKEHINHAVDNNGSRFGIKLKQSLGGDFYTLGRAEWRMRGEAPSQHDFDHVYTHFLYAGFGHKQFGELTYGNMPTITDEVKQTDLANTYSLSDGLLDGSARRVAQYVYNGNYGSNKVKFGAYYGGSSKRSMKNLDLANKRKNAWGTGLIFNHEIDSIQNVTVAAGFTREISENVNNTSLFRNAYGLGLAYNFVHTTYGVDLERQITKNQGDKRTKNEVRAVIRQGLNEDWNVYAMYAYKTDKHSNNTDRTRQFMVGTEYYVFNQGSLKVKPFIEWQATRTKYENSAVDRSRDFKTVIGLRAFW
jgi:predicted porin